MKIMKYLHEVGVSRNYLLQYVCAVCECSVKLKYFVSGVCFRNFLCSHFSVESESDKFRNDDNNSKEKTRAFAFVIFITVSHLGEEKRVVSKSMPVYLTCSLRTWKLPRETNGLCKSVVIFLARSQPGPNIVFIKM